MSGLTSAATNEMNIWQPIAVLLTVALAISLRFSPKLRGYQFTAWIIAAVTAAMIYPATFLHVGDFDLRNKWLILIVVQTVMFGMGTQMSLHDFTGIVKAPRGVLVGIVCHFSVMPLVGLALTKIFHFEPEIAAGIILIGSCSSGLASNVMAYIAKSNLVLSVTVTAITTMVAPLMTPLLMKLLAGTMVEVKFFNMMMEIIKIVLVPIGAALIHDYLKISENKVDSYFAPVVVTDSAPSSHPSPPVGEKVSAGRMRGNVCGAVGRTIIFLLAAFGAAWLAFLALGGWNYFKANVSPDALVALGIFDFLLSAVVIGVVYHWLTRWFTRLDSWMPVASMAGIVYFTTVTTAAGRDNLLKVGALLFLAAALHNAAGYGFGYWLSRAAGLDKNSARSVAFEVGLQNGGMASGLAGAMGKLGTVGLAAAIFSPWMNVSGSVLANYWKKKPVKAD
ncbi:MAG: bile acid:sodium symporter family protein [Verrucomicrobia bacterium]|nr:MAG: bile acid:sodium symporter family protein [Verrucomicrobiota bacterium]